MKVCLVRHGETAWSLTGRHTGSTDLPLTPHGEDEARALAPRLCPMGFTHVLASPRRRARQTCELAGFGAASEIEPDLSEWDYGDYEGRRSVDIRNEIPGWDIWRDGCPGGESPVDVSARADRLIARLSTMHGTIALFSHGQFGAVLAARWIGLALLKGRHFPLHTASVSLLGYDAHLPDQRTIELWNESRSDSIRVRER
ncbi:histidine phosphatase family protein [Thiocapsa sp.]|uniref:histidine phosphatase family protein n=1 Tax=Thiocapsa sp. TaxID=2024551 RepID=UPI003593963A